MYVYVCTLAHVIIPASQMLMDPMGGIVMTNDGNAILREVDLQLCCCIDTVYVSHFITHASNLCPYPPASPLLPPSAFSLLSHPTRFRCSILQPSP